VKIKIVDGVIYRGSSPETDADWQYLKSLGIKYCLDLQTGASPMKDGSPLEESLKSDEFGIRTYAHPLSELLPPTRLELANAMNFLINHDHVFVHCKAGVDRTGMVIASYRILKGWSKSKAIWEMRGMGMHLWYYWWGWFL